MKGRYLRGWVGLGVLLALSLANGSLRAAAVGLQGVVKSVDVEGGKLVVVEMGTDALIGLTVNPQTRITSNDGGPMSLGDLKRGDGVGIAHQDSIATSILVNQAPLLGTVDRIDPDGKKLILSEKGTDRQIPVALGAKTLIMTVKGKAIELRHLKSGDGVAVQYAGREVVKVIVHVKPEELTAHVKSISADLRSLIVTEVVTNVDTKVMITPNTTIISNEGKTMELKDLKKGDGVGIAHHDSVAEEIVVNAAPAR
jgi:Cu/Ag efflux protein CusF